MNMAPVGGATIRPRAPLKSGKYTKNSGHTLVITLLFYLGYGLKVKECVTGV